MKHVFLILFLLITTLSFAPNLSERQIVDKHSYILALLREEKIEERIKEIENLDFTGTLLVEYLDLIDPSLPDIALRQFILETGWFKSKSFTEYNNLGGMRLPKIRNTMATGRALNHASYDHWTHSVKDYIQWKRYWESKGYCTKDYYKFLKNVGYATAHDYESKLKNIKLERLYAITKNKNTPCC